MKVFLTSLVLIVLIACSSEEKLWVISPPISDEITKINENGESIIPNGRIIKPAGISYKIAPHPYGIAVSKSGKYIATANAGTNPISVSILEMQRDSSYKIFQIPEGYSTDKGILEAVYMGLAISPDEKTLYASGGEANLIHIIDLESKKKIDEIKCNAISDSFDVNYGYIGDLVLTNDGKFIYGVDQVNFRVFKIDISAKTVINEYKTGRYPFGIALSPDEKELYVANVGMYEYNVMNNITLENFREKSLDYPAFGYLSKESEEGIKNDSVTIPGLGEANIPESFSVWTYNIIDSLKIKSKIKTGYLVGEKIEGIPAVGGSSPNSIVATDKYVFVSNGNNDCISVIDKNADTVLTDIKLYLDPRIKKYRGIIPFGLALSPDDKYLFVAESGINAVGVINIETLEVLGHIPTGWFPSKLKVSGDGKKLIVASAKGYGSGPNGGKTFTPGPEGSYVGNLMKGIVSIIEIPQKKELNEYTRKTIGYNYKFTDVDIIDNKEKEIIPHHYSQSNSPIKYIVFVSKENRTYDEVFGQLKNGRGDESLARFGLKKTFSNRNKDKELQNVDVMPNHISLAEKFAIGDNFYCDSDHSADGHRWLVSTYPNEWVETSVTSAYAGQREGKLDSKAPGYKSFVGSSGAIYPEDYNEAGSLWDHLDRNNISFFNFGFGLELAPAYSEKAFKYTGVRYVVNYPIPQPLYENSSKKYATYNMGIPDQFRMDMFIEEFNEKWMGKNNLPSVLTVILPNDHGAGEAPDAGYPFFESYMADNDLALGRLVEFLSHTEYWKNMVIVVTEDDPQGGVDHIDAHRSVLMVISPFVKNNFVSKKHYSFGSIFKTFWNILGIPYLNQYDASAHDFGDFFKNEPDFSPYNAIAPDKRLFDPQKAFDPFDEEFNWKSVVESPVIDNPQDMERISREEQNIRDNNK